MKRLINHLLCIKTRYYVSAVIILASIAITPTAYRAAYAFRGYHAVGGEALIIPLGIITAVALCQILNDYDFAKKRRARNKNNNRPIPFPKRHR